LGVGDRDGKKAEQSQGEATKDPVLLPRKPTRLRVSPQTTQKPGKFPGFWRNFRLIKNQRE
jgi:hypothetical protein